ncbi:hypothetical protein AJ80_09194 [Polytolypa hystricis UAMH7299]|uniref:Uncharacterized protein n=1 Tax=Polytolypa hystricis (strain UAMH7299) TaxID=1447883 RepID=A0A2B7WUP5_POLH7|nr:hypothetical protein AJ80_09194 [Polytolypa hystricis UAMH7299]
MFNLDDSAAAKPAAIAGGVVVAAEVAVDGVADVIKGDNSESAASSCSRSCSSGNKTELTSMGSGFHYPQHGGPPAIAIVGMAMRLPGSVKTSEQFWDMLVNKQDGRCRVPSDRYNIDAFYSATQKPGTVNTEYGYFLRDSIDALDAGFFSMNKIEIAKLDPQQRLLLEVVWECMENGGQTGWRGKDIGCYVGVFGEDWLNLSNKDPQLLDMYHVNGTGDFAVANRVSYEFDLKGPSITVRTACSSALVGLHEACQAIYAGNCSSAIVAGTNLILSPTMTIAMSGHNVLSPSGTCKTFDAAADGYARGEAINAVYIKKLDDALAAGDPIRAVIRSTATNCDGKTQGFSQPSSEGHERMIREAYSRAKIEDFCKTGYVECHGTGTAVGDPLEAAAVANVFGEKGIYIGAVKPNVGHSEGASGLTGLIKAILALEHKTIPPNINFSTPNPKIPFEKAKLSVPMSATPWPADRCERASINSFGIGGANAHVILDSFPSFCPQRAQHKQPVNDEHTPRLLLISANSSVSLQRRMNDLQTYLATKPSALNDAAYTLGMRREHLKHKAFIVAQADAVLHVSDSLKPNSAPPGLAFVFTGQGAQWAGMGRELITGNEGFRSNIQNMDKILQALDNPPSWTIEAELSKSSTETRIDKAEFSQPLCTAVQIGIVNLLASWNIRPSAVLGHSSGEIAAAYTSGAITAEAAIIIAYYRGLVTKLQRRAGGMVAVGLSREIVAPYLVDGVVVGCENSPRSVTLSGDEEGLDEVVAKLREDHPDALFRRLRVEMAYHSSHMTGIGGAYEALIRPYATSIKPKIPFYSSLTGEVISQPGQLEATYWRGNLESTVLFYTAVRSILETVDSQNTVFMEIGPHSALAGPLRQIFSQALPRQEPTYVPTLLRNKDQLSSLLAAAGQLHVRGIPIDMLAINGPGKVLTDIPLYPWQHDTKYWHESRISRYWRLRQFAQHELLGSRVPESSDLEPVWRCMLSLSDAPWLRDHKVLQNTVFPCAGYIGMIGEAVRQISGSRSYTIRRLVVNMALVLQESSMTEIVTSMTPIALTDSLESVWYNFTISSYNGSVWIKHCVGQARPGSAYEHGSREIKPCARRIRSNDWYRALGKLGLNYGPRFNQVQDITADPVGDTATANIQHDKTWHESEYLLHPTSIDQILQIFTVAISNGLARRLATIPLPVSIEDIYIGASVETITAQINARISPNGTVNGDAVATSADGQIVVSLHGCKSVPFENEVVGSDIDKSAAVRFEWNPLIEYMQASELMAPLTSRKETMKMVEKLCLLCIIETAERTRSLNIGTEHLARFATWLQHQSRLISSSRQNVVVAEAAKWAAQDSAARLTAIKLIATAVKETNLAPAGELIRRVFTNLEGIFEGKIDPLELLIENSGLTNLYNLLQANWDCSNFFRLVSHARPTLRVLEIGAGTGGTTADILQHLQSAEGVRMYAKYTYTDVSAGFFPAAKERFAAFQALEYRVLDISRDPVEQGFVAEGFDLIVASNVLHATPCISSTLRNVRRLLAPGGHLFLQELCPVMRFINYIMGVLPGWWLGAFEGRTQEPYVSPQRWHFELRNAGFSGADIIAYDDEQPFHLNANIVATTASIPAPSEVTFLSHATFNPIVEEAKNQFLQQGYTVNLCTLDDPPPQTGDVISLLDLDGPFFHNLSEPNLCAFQQYLTNCPSATGTLWVTKPVQVQCQDPRYSLALGVSRTIRSELSLDFGTLELSSFDAHGWQALVRTYERFRARKRLNDVDPDFEYAFHDGKVHVARFHWVSTAERLLGGIDCDEKARQLVIGKYGLLDSLCWVQRDIAELQGDQVEISVQSAGLNFRDILVSMGIVDAPPDTLGVEGAGIIRAIGPHCIDLVVGDRVVFMHPGSFATRIVASAKLCARIPDEKLSLENAATMASVYSTAIHALVEMGRLEKGQTVLIQSACGGVGIAAVRICRMIGAEIYATVGSESKVQYLMDTFGIPRNHIFDSRSISFEPDLMRETHGRGVDVVLNSLSGELLHAAWRCVAKFGKMIEIGKRDFLGHGMLNMDVFQSNRSFVGVDLAGFIDERPEACRRLLEQCMEYYVQGKIDPISPITVFDAAHISDAFRYMQKGQHIGKIVVNFPDESAPLPETRKKEQARFSPTASYLLVGGLGGLGRSVSTWMVEYGARNFVYLSRSAGASDGDTHFFEELEAQGCRVTSVAGSVANLADVQRAVELCGDEIGGVIQMSMVLRDRNLAQMSHEDWHTPLSSKVSGTWNLHRALQGRTHDFFLLFSSTSGIVGQPGQANYAAANTFLDSFVQYRHSLSLPASVIDIGVVEDIGYVAQNQTTLEQLRASSYHFVPERDLLDSVQLALQKSWPQQPPSPPTTAPAPGLTSCANPSQITIGLKSSKPLSAPDNRIVFRRDIRLSIHRNLEVLIETDKQHTNEGLKEFLVAVSTDPSILENPETIDFLNAEMRNVIDTFILRPDDSDDDGEGGGGGSGGVSLANLGVDSLVSIEIRNWWRQILGLEISVLEIMNAGSIAQLAGIALGGLKVKFGGERVKAE